MQLCQRLDRLGRAGGVFVGGARCAREQGRLDAEDAALAFVLLKLLLIKPPYHQYNMPVTLFYFAIRGRGEPIRLLLEDSK